MDTPNRYWRVASRCCLLGTLLVLVAACASTSSGPEGPIRLTLWKHETAQQEKPANAAMFKRFNESQDDWELDVQLLPQGSYMDAIIVSSLAGRMPCLMTVDQPLVPTFVWAEHLRPIDDLLPAEVFEEVSPTALGRYRDRTYSIGQFDAALAMFSTRPVLESIAARVPSLQEPWSLEEFERILAALKAGGQYAYPLDVDAREINADWWIYAFSPMLQSFGGDLLDRSTGVTAEGYLNGAEAVRWGHWFQQLFERGYANRKEPDDRSFHQGRSAIKYVGNWWALDYAEIWGDDLLILPPPNLGHGPVIGGGSWQWAVSRTCEHPEGAAAFLNFIMSAEEIAAMSEAAGMVPVTERAAALTSRYSPGGDWRIFFELMNRYAVMRPATPAFVSVKNAFTKASRDIMNGKEVRDALDDAVDDIERVIQDNDGFRVDGAGGGA